MTIILLCQLFLGMGKVIGSGFGFSSFLLRKPTVRPFLSAVLSDHQGIEFMYFIDRAGLHWISSRINQHGLQTSMPYAYKHKSARHFPLVVSIFSSISFVGSGVSLIEM